MLDGDRIVVFGGMDPSGGGISDKLLILDLGTSEWYVLNGHATEGSLFYCGVGRNKDICPANQALVMATL